MRAGVGGGGFRGAGGCLEGAGGDGELEGDLDAYLSIYLSIYLSCYISIYGCLEGAGGDGELEGGGRLLLHQRLDHVGVLVAAAVRQPLQVLLHIYNDVMYIRT